jgi:vacuolar protein 8
VLLLLETYLRKVRSKSLLFELGLKLTFDAVGDYTIFIQDWTEPIGGIHGYLSRFLQSGDPTFQHIAIWTLLQLLESEDKTLIGLIGKSDDIVEQIKTIAKRQIEPDNEFEDDDEGEVVSLAQQCLELLGQSMSKAHIEG